MSTKQQSPPRVKTSTKSTALEKLSFAYEGRRVRTAGTPDAPWFVASDVCAILDINVENVRRLEADEKGLSSIQTLGGTQQMAVVNEFGLYSLIFGSRKPEAKAFKRWVTHEVLPAIRKTGKYVGRPPKKLLPHHDEEWQHHRLEGTDRRKSYTAALQGAGCNKPGHYMANTTGMYRGLFLIPTAKGIHEAAGAPSSRPTRDLLNTKAVTALSLAELVAAERIVNNGASTASQCVQISTEVAAGIAQAVGGRFNPVEVAQQRVADVNRHSLN